MYRHSLFALLFLFLAAACASSQDPPQSIFSESSAEMQSRFLAAHNEWRGTVEVPPLQWSKSLEAYAQDWADTLQRRGCRPEHSDADGYGENIAWAGGTRLTPERVVALWGEEEKFYDYESNSCADGEVCGHYTQVVWKDTLAVGCAVPRCENSEIWVCNYDPPGNWVGEKPY